MTDISRLEHRANEEARHGNREALEQAHKAGWDAAIEAALDIEKELAKSTAHFVRHDDWKHYKEGCELYCQKIRALPYKPQEDVTDG